MDIWKNACSAEMSIFDYIETTLLCLFAMFSLLVFLYVGVSQAPMKLVICQSVASFVLLLCFLNCRRWWEALLYVIVTGVLLNISQTDKNVHEFNRWIIRIYNNGV